MKNVYNVMRQRGGAECDQAPALWCLDSIHAFLDRHQNHDGMGYSVLHKETSGVVYMAGASASECIY